MKKLIKLHEEWCKTGSLPKSGLCESIPKQYKNAFNMLKPTQQEFNEIIYSDLSDTFWGSGLPFYDYTKWYSYTPLRQTIVLLICAMHDEI